MSRSSLFSVFTKAFLLLIFFIFLFITACGSTGSAETSNEDSSDKEETGVSSTDTEAETVAETPTDPQTVDPIQQQKPRLPEPEVELPSIPYDKTELPTIQKLDGMIMDEARLQAAYNMVNKELDVLEEKAETSMSGTPEDIARAIMVKVNAVNHFNSFAVPVAEEAMKIFKEKYASDSEFSGLFRDTYFAAEEEITGGSMASDNLIIKDDVKRREVWSHFSNGYMPSISSDLYDMERLLENSREIREEVIGSVVSNVNTTLMVADYRKGKDLTDMLNGAMSNLKTVQVLDPENESIATAMASVKEKKEKRQEEIQKALDEYRFPERYSGGNAPSGASELENRMKDFLSKFKYTETKNYEVLAIKVAGPWINIYNALTGVHMYSQIDFYVAVPAVEGDGIVDVLLVTGKTGGPHHNAFGTYSVGGIGQMKKSNL